MNTQLVMACATVLSLCLGAAAFLFVIWPSIRNAERRGERLERWLESPEAKELYQAAKSKIIGFGTPGGSASREAFLRETSQEEEGTVKL